MKNILIAYTTNAGSTAEIANVIGEELLRLGNTVTIKRLEEAGPLQAYEAILIGGPMNFGWHAAAQRFLRKNQLELKQKRVALFCTALRLTQTETTQINQVPVYLDTALAKPAKKSGNLSLREKYALPENYLKPLFKVAPFVKPVNMAIFGGKLDGKDLNLMQRFTVQMLLGAQPGDFRNWPAIRQWAQEINPLL